MLAYYLIFSYPDGHSGEDIIIEQGYEATGFVLKQFYNAKNIENAPLFWTKIGTIDWELLLHIKYERKIY